jgi:hypothetical protein
MDAIASAAEAPQIATAPPVSVPNALPSLSMRATRIPHTTVRATDATTRPIVPQPSACTWVIVMRSPRRATPVRSTTEEAIWIPGRQRPSSARKLSAMPSSSANSIAEAL